MNLGRSKKTELDFLDDVFTPTEKQWLTGSFMLMAMYVVVAGPFIIATFFDFSPTVMMQTFGMLVLGHAVGYTVTSIERNMYTSAVARWVETRRPSKSEIYHAMRIARQNNNLTLRRILKDHVSLRTLLA